MTKEKRKRAVLRYLAESDMALSLKAIYVNLERDGYTFVYKTAQRHLSELEDEGKVQRLKSSDRFFVITDEGREWLKNGDDPHA